MKKHKKQKLYELHDGQNLWVNQWLRRHSFKTPQAFVRLIFTLGMKEYERQSKKVNK